MYFVENDTNRQPVYIIAEAGVNHNGSVEIAKELVNTAVKAGADAVKFQTFRAEKLVSRTALKADYQKMTTGSEGSQLEMLKKLELTYSDHRILYEYCNQAGIEFLSTPFDIESLGFLTTQIGLNTIKISSGDITNLPLLYETAGTGAKIILSSGISTLGTLEDALGAIALGYTLYEGNPTVKGMEEAYYSRAGQEMLRAKVTLLHCTTDYPTQYNDVHLNKMLTMKRAFGLPVGYSDHTIGLEISLAAVAMGAEVIEKHFTLDKQMEGPDHKASIEPEELTRLVKQIRNIEQSLGIFTKIPAFSEMKNAHAARKSVVAAKTIQQGEIFSKDNLTIKRPGNGYPPSSYWALLGRKAEKTFEADDLIE
ncbi:N-acetylneuraminate synthase [Paenibacillus sp. S150]|uniref:N-acetylneuraminate synthase n=1 Tax=Paenibacillus sp. S150 TaxID=2749826 RepID=UPI001C65DC29|nr:N-acetylneuraminate synthase [Paenibacillus sp. S150]